MQVAERLLTAEEFFLLPSPVEGGKMELVEGRVVAMSPVGEQHGEVAVTLGGEMLAFARKHKLGRVMVETGFRLRSNPDTVLAPDVSFVAAGRLKPDRDKSRFVEGAPTLAVEVSSPSDLDSEIAGKVIAYLDAGAERVWVVRPELKTVTVHRLGGDAHTYGAGATLSSDDAGFETPGFELAVSDLFA